MSTLPEQFSAARKSQLEAQVNFFSAYTAKAVESAELILSLNLNTTRASLEKSSAAVRQLLTVKDPRDLLALTTQAQENFDSMIAYSRALFSLASGAQLALFAPAAKVLAGPVAAPASPKPVPPMPAPTLAPTLAAVPAPAAVASPAPAAGAEPAAAVPPETVTAKPIAKAASKVAAKPATRKPAAAPFPAAASKVVVSGVKPVDAAPPPAQAEAKQLDMLAPKPRKKGKAK